MKRQHSGRPHKDDEQNRQRAILEAAVQLYAKDGFEATTFKHIADEAGVATSLIRHYFGSKEEFRDTCHDYVISEVERIFSAISQNLSADPKKEDIELLGQGMVDQMRSRVYLLRYLARLFLLGNDKANALFKQYYEVTKQVTDRFDAAGMLHEKADPIWVSFTLIFNQLGPVFLAEQMAQVLGIDPYQQDMSQARSLNQAHFLKQGIFKDDA